MLRHVEGLLAAVAVTLAAQLVASGDAWGAGEAVTLSSFAGTWYGHTRALSVNGKGHAVESISDGCCDRIVVLHMTLSRPHGTAAHASVSARVTFVHIYDQSVFGPRDPPPRPGERTRLRLDNGVVVEPLTRVNYCDLSADERGTCGA